MIRRVPSNKQSGEQLGGCQVVRISLIVQESNRSQEHTRVARKTSSSQENAKLPEAHEVLSGREGAKPCGERRVVRRGALEWVGCATIRHGYDSELNHESTQNQVFFA